MGTLYVAGMPAGNPKDATLRALRVLRQVKLVLCQDTTRGREFLAHHQIDTPLKKAEINSLLPALRTGDVALLIGMENAASHHLVRAAVKQGFDVAAVPGPAAAVTALVISGLPADAYVSLGYLPGEAAERRELLASLAEEQRTLVTFERAKSMPQTLRDVKETLGDRPLALSPVRGGPKAKVWRGTVQEAKDRFETEPPSGDWVLVIGGATEKTLRWSEEQVRAELDRLLGEGMKRKVAARQLARASGWRPRELYNLGLE